MIRVTTAAVLVLAASGSAQPAITIDVENPVLMPGESTVVTMKAGFDPAYHAIAIVTTNFLTSVGSTGFSDAAVAPRLSWFPGVTPGTASATGYDDIVAGQLSAAVGPGYADPTNPIDFWSATYTAPIDVAVPFDLQLSTSTSRYDVYETASSFWTSRLDELVEGTATIHVIPAPASASLLALGLLAMRRRR